MREWIVPDEDIGVDGAYFDYRELLRCKDCKYFELNYFEKLDAISIPVIVAHEICTRWGGGCKTLPDGYCFMAERKENND